MPISMYTPTATQRGRRIGFIGESLVEHHHTANSSYKMSSWSRGPLNWAQVLNPGMFVFDAWHDQTVRPGWEPSGAGTTIGFSGCNAGVGGQTADQIAARKSYFVNNVDVDIVLISIGTNSIPLSTAQEIHAKRVEMVDYYLARGKTVVLFTVLNRSTATWPTTSNYRKKCYHVNQLSRSLVDTRKNCFLFDWNEYWVDYLSVDGNPRAGYSPDGTHFATLSAYHIGKKLGEFLKVLLPPGSKRVFSPDDKYDAVHNPLGNLMSNPVLSGTGGTASAPATGTVADGMRIIRSSGAGAVACSKETRSDGRGYWQTMVFTPSGAAGTDLYYYQTSSTDIPHGLPVGTWLRASVEVECGAWGGWQGVTMHVRDTAAAGILAYGMEDYLGDAWPQEAWSGTIMTPPFQIVDAASSTRWQLRVKTKNDASGTGTLKVSNVELRVVDDPRSIVNYRPI